MFHGKFFTFEIAYSIVGFSAAALILNDLIENDFEPAGAYTNARLLLTGNLHFGGIVGFVGFRVHVLGIAGDLDIGEARRPAV